MQRCELFSGLGQTGQVYTLNGMVLKIGIIL